MNTSAAVEIKKLDINKYNRYIEVILGRGKSLMEFDPQISCLLNDSNTDLINFYKYLQEPELHSELNSFSDNWRLLVRFAEFSSEEIFMAFQDFEKGIISSEDVNFMIRAIVMMNMNHDEFIPLFEQKFIISIDLFTNALIKSVVNTILKIKGDKIGSEPDCFNQNIETAFCEGFYDHFRNLVNMQKTDIIDCISLSKHFASWYFIKEFGKGQHLHYDQNGNLKNHYGGSKYNRLDFGIRVNQVCNSAFSAKLNHSELYNINPVDFLKEVKVNDKDIVVANIHNSNIILANGKNYSGINSQLDQIRQLLELNINLIIISNDEDIVKEFEQQPNSNLSTHKNGDDYYLTNF